MDPSSFARGIFENKKSIKHVTIPVFCLYGELDKNCCDMKKLQNIVKKQIFSPNLLQKYNFFP